MMSTTKDNQTLVIPGWNIRAEIFEKHIPNALFFTPPKATTAKPYDEAIQYLGAQNITHQRDKINIIGWSMGGQIAMLFAAQHPEKVASLTLLSTAAIFSRNAQDKQSFNELCKTDFPRASKYFHRLMGSMSIEQSLALKKQFINDQENALAYLHELHTRDLTEVAKKITCPVKIIHAIDDQIIPYSEAVYLQQLIPQAVLETIPGNQHFPLYADYDKICQLL